MPAELLRVCEGPDLAEITTNGDIEAALIESTVALRTCNEDKDAIREWGPE